MRKPVTPTPELAAKPVTPTPELAAKPANAIVSVASYELFATPTKSPFIRFSAKLAANYRIDEAVCFRASGPSLLSKLQERLVICVRQFGHGVVPAEFLVVWAGDSDYVNLPHITPHARDPEDSPTLQWSFWQGCRIGGGLYHDVFDVTHFVNLQIPET